MFYWTALNNGLCFEVNLICFFLFQAVLVPLNLTRATNSLMSFGLPEKLQKANSHLVSSQWIWPDGDTTGTYRPISYGLGRSLLFGEWTGNVCLYRSDAVDGGG